jgi:hypothetical protein
MKGSFGGINENDYNYWPTMKNLVVKGIYKKKKTFGMGKGGFK